MGQQRDRGERKGGERRRGDGPLRKFLDPPPDALTFARSKHQKPKGYACRMATKFSSAVSRLLTSFLPKPLFYLASMVTGMSTSIHATSTYGNFFLQKASLLSKSQHMRRSIVELSRTAVTILYRTVTCYSHMLQCSSSSYNKLL